MESFRIAAEASELQRCCKHTCAAAGNRTAMLMMRTLMDPPAVPNCQLKP